MTMAEKILARAAGREVVRAGEFVTASPDRLMINDMIVLVANILRNAGIERLADPDKVIIVLDHFVPAPSAKHAEMISNAMAIIKKFNIRHNLGAAGVSHQVLCERGYAHPGDLILGTDSHSTMYGAFGSAGAGIGATEMAYLLVANELWFQAPESIRFNLSGKLAAGVSAKDVVLHVIGAFGGDFAAYKAIEYGGGGATTLSMSERMTMSNMGAEIGAKFAMFEVDATTKDFLAQTGVRGTDNFQPDPEATYFESHSIDLGIIEPQIACPPRPDNTKPVSDVTGVKINQAYLGSCTNARLDDFAIASKILKDRKIHQDTTLLVAPASQHILLEAVRAGYVETLVAAGAQILPAGCGACAGLHSGLLGKGDVCLSSTNRNFPGRMGSPEAEIYLGSPAAVVAAALTGEICDPREFWIGDEGAVE